MNIRKSLFGAVMLAAALVSINAHGFTVDADLPAGNIVVDGIDGDTVKVRRTCAIPICGSTGRSG